MVRVWVAPGAIVKYEVKSIPSWGAGKLQVENLARISPYTGGYYMCKDIFIFIATVEGYYPSAVIATFTAPTNQNESCSHKLHVCIFGPAHGGAQLSSDWLAPAP